MSDPACFGWGLGLADFLFYFEVGAGLIGFPSFWARDLGVFFLPRFPFSLRVALFCLSRVGMNHDVKTEPSYVFVCVFSCIVPAVLTTPRPTCLFRTAPFCPRHVFFSSQKKEPSEQQTTHHPLAASSRGRAQKKEESTTC